MSEEKIKWSVKDGHRVTFDNGRGVINVYEKGEIINVTEEVIKPYRHMVEKFEHTPQGGAKPIDHEKRHAELLNAKYGEFPKHITENARLFREQCKKEDEQKLAMSEGRVFKNELEAPEVDEKPETKTKSKSNKRKGKK